MFVNIPVQEYTSMKCKEKEDEIELRRLRTENSLLRQRIDLLETESSDLADRLIQGQVTRAEVETGRDGHLVNSLEYFIYPHGKDEYDSESKFQDSNFLLKNKSLN